MSILLLLFKRIIITFVIHPTCPSVSTNQEVSFNDGQLSNHKVPSIFFCFLHKQSSNLNTAPRYTQFIESEVQEVVGGSFVDFFLIIGHREWADIVRGESLLHDYKIQSSDMTVHFWIRL